MNFIVVVLGILAAAFLLSTLFLLKTLKQTKASLQELLRESETITETPKVNSGDLYFKIDRNFIITFFDNAGSDFNAPALNGQPVIGSLMEDNKATKEFLLETFNKIAKKQTTFNTHLLLKRPDGKNMLFLARIRPILNEVLKCDGLSFLCKDVSQTDHLENELSDLQSIDPFTNILNEKTLEKRFAHDFNLATRYNKELSAIVVELKDIYEFIAKGIDFETADKMLKAVSSLCLESLPEEGYAGRVDKTKIVMALKNVSRDEARQKALDLFGKAVNAIKALRIDEANAQMMVISYSNRKGFTDSYDAMSGRIQRHINMALKLKEYGIISSDKRHTAVFDLENIKG